MAMPCAFAQSSPKGAVDSIPVVSVCDIVNNPLQFKGKLVQVRAQVWPVSPGHYGQYWMNQSSAEFDKVCRFLPARYLGTTYLAQSAVGTFFGRVLSILCLAAPLASLVEERRRRRYSLSRRCLMSPYEMKCESWFRRCGSTIAKPAPLSDRSKLASWSPHFDGVCASCDIFFPLVGDFYLLASFCGKLLAF